MRGGVGQQDWHPSRSLKVGFMPCTPETCLGERGGDTTEHGAAAWMDTYLSELVLEGSGFCMIRKSSETRTWKCKVLVAKATDTKPVSSPARPNPIGLPVPDTPGNGLRVHTTEDADIGSPRTSAWKARPAGGCLLTPATAGAGTPDNTSGGRGRESGGPQLERMRR